MEAISHPAETDIKKSSNNVHEGIIYQSSTITLLDVAIFLKYCWNNENKHHSSIQGIFSSFHIPNYWFNLHHPYVKTSNGTKRFKYEDLNSNRELDAKSGENSAGNNDNSELDLEFIKDEFKKMLDRVSMPLFPSTSTQYFDSEPHRPNELLWKELLSFPDYLNMMKSMLSFALVQPSNYDCEIERIVIPSSECLQLSLDQLFFKHIINEASNPTVFKLIPNSIEYWMPPNSSFVISELSQASKLLPPISPNSGFDLIVMDPPYFNISAKRSRSYKREDMYRLFELPVPKIINPEGGMLAVWITNRPKVRRFVINKLFKDWGISFVAEWAWVKMTTKGEPVVDFDSNHKKPYEIVLIGTRGAPTGKHLVPARHVIASVPCKIHSRKPPLFDLLLPYLPQKETNASFLELFGRSLYPNTITWGNEPIKFQTTDSYL